MMNYKKMMMNEETFFSINRPKTNPVMIDGMRQNKASVNLIAKTIADNPNEATAQIGKYLFWQKIQTKGEKSGSTKTNRKDRIGIKATIKTKRVFKPAKMDIKAMF